MLLLDENQLDLAKQNNLLALNLIEDLAAPAPSLNIKLADIHNIRAQILEVQDPKEALKNCQQSMDILEHLKDRQDFRQPLGLQQALGDLGYNYAELADRALKLGSLTDARAAADNLSRLLPDLADQDRDALSKHYEQLRSKIPKAD
jgi:hypothetical protein